MLKNKNINIYKSKAQNIKTDNSINYYIYLFKYTIITISQNNFDVCF